MRTLISWVLLTLFIWITFTAVFAGDEIIEIIEKHDTECAANLGKEVVLKADTLVIVDYSIWKDTYTLDNGTKINRDLFEKIVAD